VTDWPYCPADYPDVVFKRDFQGTQLGCDCLGVASPWIDNVNEMVIGKACSVNQTLAGCDTAQPLGAKSQNFIDGKMICGRPNGKTF
jgi:hypothetical protein